MTTGSVSYVGQISMQIPSQTGSLLGANQHPYLDDLIDYYITKGLSVELKKVDYEFQIGGNEMLVIKH